MSQAELTEVLPLPELVPIIIRDYKQIVARRDFDAQKQLIDNDVGWQKNGTLYVRFCAVLCCGFLCAASANDITPIGFASELGENPGYAPAEERCKHNDNKLDFVVDGKILTIVEKDRSYRNNNDDQALVSHTSVSTHSPKQKDKLKVRKYVNSCGSDGLSLLQYVIMIGATGDVESLLDHGASVNLPRDKDGWSPLDVANSTSHYC